MDQQTVRDVIRGVESGPHQLNGHTKSAPVELDAIAVYSCDASGVITYCNDRAVQLWGRRPEIGDTDERFCGSHKLYRMDGGYMPHEKCPMADVLNGKVSGIHDAEVHIERPDGSRVVVIVNIAPLIDDNGTIVGAMNSFYDASDRNDIEGARAKPFGK